jgi:hypothetical protein
VLSTPPVNRHAGAGAFRGRIRLVAGQAKPTLNTAPILQGHGIAQVRERVQRAFDAVHTCLANEFDGRTEASAYRRDSTAALPIPPPRPLAERAALLHEGGRAALPARIASRTLPRGIDPLFSWSQRQIDHRQVQQTKSRP